MRFNSCRSLQNSFSTLRNATMQFAASLYEGCGFNCQRRAFPCGVCLLSLSESAWVPSLCKACMRLDCWNASRCEWVLLACPGCNPTFALKQLGLAPAPSDEVEIGWGKWGCWWKSLQMNPTLVKFSSSEWTCALKNQYLDQVGSNYWHGVKFYFRLFYFELHTIQSHRPMVQKPCFANSKNKFNRNSLPIWQQICQCLLTSSISLARLKLSEALVEACMFCSSREILKTKKTWGNHLSWMLEENR